MAANQEKGHWDPQNQQALSWTKEIQDFLDIRTSSLTQAFRNIH